MIVEHRRRHDRGGGDLAQRHRRLPVRARRRQPHRRGDRSLHQAQVQPASSASARPRRSRSRSAAPCRSKRTLKVDVRGRDQVAGLPKTMQRHLQRDHRRHRRAAGADRAARSSRCWSGRRPSCPSDIIDKGMVMTGGGVAAAQPRPAADQRDRHPLPRRGAPARLRRPGHRAGAGEHGRAEEVAGPTLLTPSGYALRLRLCPAGAEGRGMEPFAEALGASVAAAALGGERSPGAAGLGVGHPGGRPGLHRRAGAADDGRPPGAALAPGLRLHGHLRRPRDGQERPPARGGGDLPPAPLRRRPLRRTRPGGAGGGYRPAPRAPPWSGWARSPGGRSAGRCWC